MELNQVQSYDELCKSINAPYTGDEVVENLKKALSTTNSGPGGIVGGPLMLENLDSIMTEVLITEQHFKLFNAMPRIPSAQPYFEYNKHTGFGSRRGSVGFAEGGGPQGSLSAFERNGIYNKFLGVRGGVTHQMLVSNQNGGSFEDPTVRENRDRTLELFERIEREMVFGDKTINDENGTEVHFDGLLTTMESVLPAHVIDMDGEPLTYDEIDDTSEKLVTTGKQISVNGYTSFMSTHVNRGLNQQYQDRNVVRHNKDGNMGGSYQPGFTLPGYDGQFGTIKFEHSILLEEVENSAPETVALANSPAAPATTAGVAGANAASKMEAGTFYYTAAAFNDTGESLGTVSTGVAVTAGQEVVVTIARVAGATGYRLYRGTLVDMSDAIWIARITQTPSADPTHTDVNQWRTTDYATGLEKQNGLSIIIKPDPKDLCTSQMTPLVKMPLPQIDTTFPFLLLLYCVLVVKAPERVMIYKNCGKYTAP